MNYNDIHILDIIADDKPRIIKPNININTIGTWQKYKYDPKFKHLFKNIKVKESDNSFKIDYFNITIYGKNKNNESIVCNITDYRPYFHLKIPHSWRKKYIEETFLKNLDVPKYLQEPNIKGKIVESYDFYGYEHDYKNNCRKSYNFVTLEFLNYKSFQKYKYQISNKFKYYKEKINNNEKIDKKIIDWINLCNDDCNSNLYEANIHPIIRFIHDSNIKPSGWINIINNKKCIVIEDEYKDYNTDIQLDTSIKNIESIESNDISNLRIASFDIECDSLNGDFPLANKNFKQLSSDIYYTYIKWLNNLPDDYVINIEQKKEFIKTCIDTSFTNTNLLGEYDNNINKVKSDNGLPTNIDKLSIFNDIFIDKIDKSNNKNTGTNLKELRHSVIIEIQDILDNELCNKKNKKIIVSGDPIIQIGTVFYDIGTGKIERHIEVIKNTDCEDRKICDNINGIEVYECINEEELLLHWKDLIIKLDPDIITGYNIFGFDFNYIADRVKKYSIDEEFYTMGKLKNKIELNDYSLYEKSKKKCKLEKIYSGGNMTFGDSELNYINMDGRIIFDIQSVIKKNHNLESYKLDNVSSHFMRGNIYKSEISNPHNKDICIWNFKEDNTRWWKFKTNTIGHLKIGDYISINIHSNIGETLLLNKQKFKIVYIKNDHITIDINNHNIIKELNNYKWSKLEWCLNKDDVSPKDIFDLHKYGGSSGRAKIAKYCIQDCELCINLVNLLDIIPNNIGMSNVCYVPFSYIFLRGQGVKVLSIVSKECALKNTKMPTLNNYKDDTSGFEGAIVLKPKTGIYLDDPIVVLDYASLYPSSIIEYNCSQDKYVTDEKFINENKDIIDEIIYDDYLFQKKGNSDTIEKIKTGKKIKCHFIKNEKDKITGEIIPESMGIIPTVLRNVLDARKYTRKRMKEPNVSESQMKVLDGLQLAYKITANSVYGQLGAKTSSIYMKILAACTTSIGRKRIEDAENGVKEWALSENYKEPDIIYGDTDSVFIKFSRYDKNNKLLKGDELLKHCINCGIKAGEYVDDKLRKPQNLEYEKVFYPFILISKKRYIGDKWETIKDVENNKYKRTSMGIVMKRRDNAPIVKYVFGNIIEKILCDKDFIGALKWLDQTLKDIKDGKFHENYFIISKTLNGYYKNPASIAHKVLADRIGDRDPGNKPKSSERIPFMYIQVNEYEQCGFKNVKEKFQDGFYKNGRPRFKTITVQGDPKYKKRKILPGERIENPDYIKEHNLNIDYNYYITNQIMNPVKQVLDLNTNYLKETQNIFTKHIS